MQTPQANAIKAAQSLASLMTSYVSFMNAVTAWRADNSVNTWDAIWVQMPTAATNADGTIGVPDVIPVSTNRITVPAGSPLLMTRNQLITAKSLLDTLVTLYGQAGGTLAVPNQSPATTAALLAPSGS